MNMVKMNKIIWMLVAVAGLCTLLTSCNDYETYADQKEKERDGISDFIALRGINVIDESTFHANGDVTDLSRNEYVYMNNTGVYMQIIRKGCGEPLNDNQTAELYIRFLEVSVLDTTVTYTNYLLPYDPDVMTVSRTGTTYTASFTSGLMYSAYSASVPSGWLVPFNYINVGYPDETGDISKVRLIVPHTQGHTTATSNVYPYFYEITFQRSPNS